MKCQGFFSREKNLIVFGLRIPEIFMVCCWTLQVPLNQSSAPSATRNTTDRHEPRLTTPVNRVLQERLALTQIVLCVRLVKPELSVWRWRRQTNLSLTILP